ncbi:hypothetical protein KKC17_02160 [Patescibacteria group bacterium]|nr:hypothetical protein [Patescibacteria group bacterium]
MIKGFKVFICGIFFIGLFFVLTQSVSADNSSDQLGATEIVNGNYYVTGSTVEVIGQVLSDVFVFGGTVEILGPVGGDVLVAGGNVRIQGPVQGNVRVVGGTVEISSQVSKNVLAGAGTLRLMPGSVVLGHLTAAAGTLEMAGTIEGSVKAAGGLINLSGIVKGPAEYWLGKDGQFKISSGAVMADQITYHSYNQAVIAEGAQLSYPLQFIPISEKNSAKPAVWWNWLVAIFSALVLGMVLFSWWPKTLQATAEVIIKRPWVSLGWGAVWAVFVPLLSIIFLITVIGWPLAVLLVIFYIAGFIVVPVLAGLVLINLLKINGLFSKFFGKWPGLVLLFVGIILYEIIAQVPYLGMVFVILAALAVWGALWQIVRLSFNK